MDIRAQVSMVFHLDKCIGCHTCSVACKNVWTDRPGAEYMWWNNVETKPGTGYPHRWEDQEHYQGGWRVDARRRLRLRCQTRLGGLLQLFYNPHQPDLDDYYHPWTYEYSNLFDAPEGDDQPTAKPISLLTGGEIRINAGPNWDDDLSGSSDYAAHDVNFDDLSNEERSQLFEIERVAFMYLPRICNHCVNPSCVAACPSGALYKRGEDGIVLIDQNVCRGWRACVAACPYKKIYYNWQTGKSEKCILCYPRLETGQSPACFHSCVGRIRYLGVLLYDADLIEDVMKTPAPMLVEAQRRLIADPQDERVIAAARANGISDAMIDAAQKSPVYKYVMEWQIALPLHVEFRTCPMLFYVPPLLPVMGKAGDRTYGHAADDFFSALNHSRLSTQYLARLFSAGNEPIIEGVLKKLMAVRYYRRAKELNDLPQEHVRRMMREAGLTPEQADEIYQLTAVPTVHQRYVLPPLQREEAIAESGSVELCKGTCGFGAALTSERRA